MSVKFVDSWVWWHSWENSYFTWWWVWSHYKISWIHKMLGIGELNRVRHSEKQSKTWTIHEFGSYVSQIKPPQFQLMPHLKGWGSPPSGTITTVGCPEAYTEQHCTNRKSSPSHCISLWTSLTIILSFPLGSLRVYIAHRSELPSLGQLTWVCRACALKTAV